MTFRKDTQRLRNQSQGVHQFSTTVLRWINDYNLWNLWVPQSYGGREHTFSEGLSILRQIAKIDGSLGWTITLCSGANFFIGNLHPAMAGIIFNTGHSPVLGGSSGSFGTAEKQGNTYKIDGTWHYATGAPYLTHFTLNAKLTQNGQVLKNDHGQAIIQSFVLPKKDVTIIDDWETMGLLPTATYSFTVENITCDETAVFTYNETNLPQPIFKIPFKSFADLTLWANFIGMGQHFIEEAKSHIPPARIKTLENYVISAENAMTKAAQGIESTIDAHRKFSKKELAQLHLTAAETVRQISKGILETYPYLGLRASRQSHQLNQVFRDYFTATQHPIFVDR